VQVPDNGRVATVSGTYLCEASQTCEIEVVDLMFNETFVAEPAEGTDKLKMEKEAIPIYSRHATTLFHSVNALILRSR